MTPGIGATSPPWTSSVPGTVNRGAIPNPTVPDATCTQIRPSARVTRLTERRPSTSASMSLSDQRWIRAEEVPLTVKPPSRSAR